MTELKPIDSQSEKPKRGPGPKSGTSYPYYNLDDSIKVARIVYEKGGGTCSRDQLAALLGYKTSTSGTFISRIYAAKQFGLIQFSGDTVSITERAQPILHPVMPDDGIKARVEAFLAVPLFSNTFEKFKGTSLPALVGLENLFRTEYKIVEDRIKPALRVLLDSADQSGLFKTTGARSRMILPVFATNHPKQTQSGVTGSQDHPPPTDKEKHTSGNGSDGSPPGIHPALIAMLRELPRPGSVWSKIKKERFLTAFRSILDVIYPDLEEDAEADHLAVNLRSEKMT